MISCIGKYLEVSAINDVLAEKEIFGPNVANSALEGNHYVNGKTAINIIVEALQKLQITSFIDYANAEKFKDLVEIIEKFSSEIKKPDYKSRFNL